MKWVDNLTPPTNLTGETLWHNLEVRLPVGEGKPSAYQGGADAWRISSPGQIKPIGTVRGKQDIRVPRGTNHPHEHSPKMLMRVFAFSGGIFHPTHAFPDHHHDTNLAPQRTDSKR